ncbi:MAG: DUF58 domain-containing protein [Planctomycetia bacterium]|nr:DUF58 domain-containing protein [Planctomycetia bacterium]
MTSGNRPTWLPDLTSIATLRELLAPRISDGFTGGLHQGVHPGDAVEFSGYREYTPGDDLRRLDWKHWGRTDHLYLRQSEEETSQLISIVVDETSSMRWRGGENRPEKRDVARGVAAILASVFLTSGDGVGLRRIGDRTTRDLPPSNSASQWETLIDFLDQDFPSGSPGSARCPMAERLTEYAATFVRRTRFFLLTDTLEEPESLWTAIDQLRRQRHPVTLVQILDPSELTFPYMGITGFRDPETGRVVTAMASKVRETYLRRLDVFLEQLWSFCHSRGIGHVRLVTDQPLVETLSSQFGQTGTETFTDTVSTGYSTPPPDSERKKS